ncbi:hypothetical protein [Paracoccus niistensis]|uniref:Uncharacterized protein n=1 Tax=Paracoccus niistensis TaxID=632935 RepID=A0ABV6I5Q7_9RHOB
MLKPVLVVLTLAQGGDATHLALTSAETMQDCATKAQAVQKVLEGAGHTVLAARCTDTDLEFTPYGHGGDSAERPHAWRVTLPKTGALIEPLAEGEGCTPAPDGTPAVHCARSAQGVVE